MQDRDWLERWTEGNIGWHQSEGSKSLRQFWPALEAGRRVLVPLCGKSVDLLWLAERGLDVTGVELSEVAVQAFFSEQGLAADREETARLVCYRARDLSLSLYCGDYFSFHAQAFDALYDRASLIAFDATRRPQYAEHTQSLLKPRAAHLLITLEYDQSLVDGPPFSVLADEVRAYWPRLHRVKEAEALDTCPPRFQAAGVPSVTEVTWVLRDD